MRIKGILRRRFKNILPWVNWQPIQRVEGRPGSELLAEKSGNIQFIFMHIHKCGGTSFLEAIAGMPNGICCGSLLGDHPLRTGRDLIPDSIWNHAVKFTFVRNPFARIASAYRMFREYGKQTGVFSNFSEFVELLEWIRLDRDILKEETDINKLYGSLINVFHHCGSYDNPKYLVKEMNHIGKLEHMEEELLALQRNFGITVGKPGHAKRTGAGDKYRDLYTSRERGIIEEVYHDDLERFKYHY